MSTDAPSQDRPSGPPPSHEVRAGVRTAMSASLGVAATGVTFGVLVIQTGLPWWWAPLCQAVVFAGSLEFILVGLVTSLAPLSTIALSALLVNSRHVFYALSFPLDRVRPPVARAYSVYTLTDEAYALTSVPEARTWSSTRIVAIQATLQISWVGGGLIGVALGALLPPRIPGLGFAFTALFVVLAMDAHQSSRCAALPLLAAACATAAAVLVPGSMLLVAMGAYTIVLVAAWPITRRRTRPRIGGTRAPCDPDEHHHSAEEAPHNAQ